MSPFVWYICDAGYMGSAPCPQVRRYRYSGEYPSPQSGRCRLFGEPTPSPQYLRWRVFGSCPSPRVYMGSAPYPQVRRCRYSGCRARLCRFALRRTQSERRRLFGEPTPSPQYLRWRVFGSCPSPRVYMGSAPCPQDRTLPLFGVPNPIRKTQAIWGANPKPPISPMACIWELPKPRGVYGEHPIPPMSDAAAIRENARTLIRRTQAIWGANPKPPISQMACIWEMPKPRGVYGESPMPPI